jgi:putative membrane protein
MTATQSDLAGLSRYIFRAPSWYASVAFALAIAALAGIAAFDSRYVLEDAWQGIFFIGIPTVLAGVLTPWVDQRLGGKLTPNRASLLALFCELVTVAIMTIAGVLVLLTRATGMMPPLGQDFVFDALIAALAGVFAFRLLVLVAVSRRPMVVAAVPASLQTLFGAVLLFVYSGTMRYFEIGGPITRSYLSRPERAPPELLVIVPQDFLLLGFTCLLYAGAVWLFLAVIDRPWKRGLGVSVLDFVQGFIGHIAEGTRELEDFFEELGEEAVVPVTVLSFRRTADAHAHTDGRPREKARFVLPMIHPGPMGEIGGGNLPERVADSTEALAFPPHATAGHDFNLVTEREVDTVLDAAGRALSRIDYHDTGSTAVRTAEGEATIVAQAFGDDALLVGMYAPNHADDVEYAVGLSAVAEARTHDLEEVMLVDAHNSNRGFEEVGELGHIAPGSQRSFEMIRAAGDAGAMLADVDQHPLRLGVAWEETDWGPDQGIGPLGVRVAVLDVGDQRTAYVLVDGNNMTPDLRGEIVERLTAERSPVDEAEVMTTDTHVVNLVEADNRVGTSLSNERFCDLVGRLVDGAVDDLEPVEAGMATERAEVTVFGNDRTETLASHANAMISMGGALAAAFILVVAAVSFVVLFFA